MSELDFHTLYAAFNAHDIDAVFEQLHPDVDWPNGWEGGRVRGYDEVRAYWTRQWQSIDAKVTPVGTKPTSDGRTAVTVHQVARDLDGNLLDDTTLLHVYATDENGLVTSMEIVKS